MRRRRSTTEKLFTWHLHADGAALSVETNVRHAKRQGNFVSQGNDLLNLGTQRCRQVVTNEAGCDGPAQTRLWILCEASTSSIKIGLVFKSASFHNHASNKEAWEGMREQRLGYQVSERGNPPMARLPEEFTDPQAS